eukprot:GHVU01126336.1.p1 GENE.GHVU01126336.1~~GHVU01126336.1.p1  ORF type:complete len:133 (-),score=39.47 GHVU01126336.1:675-1073(-)
MEFSDEIKKLIWKHVYDKDHEKVRDLLNEMDLTNDQLQHFVKKLLAYSMEATDDANDGVLELLVLLKKNDELDDEVIASGFDAIFSDMEQIKLDVPHAEGTMKVFVGKAQTVDLLPQDYTDPRKREKPQEDV